MATWRVARSLDTLLAQLNAKAPKRSKLSDGSIGDAAHATRDSDHNPYIKLGGLGVVTARDFTNDPAGGLDCNWLAARLVASGDPRIKYIIWNRRIWFPVKGWQPYGGTNPHDKHLHLSVSAQPGWFDSTMPWAAVSGGNDVGSPITTLPAPSPVQEDDMTPAQAAQLNELLARVQALTGATPQAGVFTAEPLVDYFWRKPLPEDHGVPILHLRNASLGVSSLLARPGADVDEQALAAALAPLLPSAAGAVLARLSDEDVARVAKASADEQSRRLAA